MDAVRQAMTITPDGQLRALDAEQQETLDRIEADAGAASEIYDHFRRYQITPDSELDSILKQQIKDGLGSLRTRLDGYQATQYGIDQDDGAAYANWVKSHQPFHWFVEFYGIMSKGGFDVVVGNPPYVEYRTIKDSYSVRGLMTEKCGNLYAMLMERSITMVKNGRFGMIVPVSGACTDGFRPLRAFLAGAGDLVVSHFNDRPSRLFDGIEHCRLSIFLLKVGPGVGSVFSTTYNKWQATERDTLFQKLAFIESTRADSDGILPKFGHSLEPSMLQKFHGTPSTVKSSAKRSAPESIFYTRKLSNFVQILDFVPAIYDAADELRKPSELKEIKFDGQLDRYGTLAFLNSTLFYWLITLFSDCRNLNKREIEMTRLNLDDKDGIRRLANIAQELMGDIKANSEMLTINYQKMGSLRIQSTYPRLSKAIIDRIDRVLAEHYGFTEEELDFIINYDIKYRMGRDG